MSSAADPGQLSLVLNFSELEVSLIVEDENNATWKTTSQKQGIPSCLCLVWLRQNISLWPSQVSWQTHRLETQICGWGLLGKKKEPEKGNKSILTTSPLLSLKHSWANTAEEVQLRTRETASQKKPHLYFGDPRVRELLEIEPFPL